MSKQVVQAAEAALISNRSAVVIAAEINSIKEQTRKMVLFNSIEIGRRLAEAKTYVPHGEWGKWLEESVSYSQSTANNLMRIFEKYGADQLSLFGDNAKSQALGNLSYTQAVALLAVPDEEREAFIQENDVENMSTRELQQAIKEKQELEQQLKEAAERERVAKEREEAAKAARQLFEKQAKEQAERAEQLQKELEAAQADGDDKAAAKLKTELKKAEKTASEAQQKMTQLEAEMAEKIKQREAELEAKMNEKLKQRELELADEAQNRVEEAAKQVAAMQQELAKNNNVAAIKVKVCFDTLVENFKALLTAVGEVQNEEEKAKFQGAVAKLCDKMKEQL